MWVRFFGETDLDACAGVVHCRLAQDDPAHAETAMTFLTRSPTDRGPDMARSPAFELAALATTHLRRGDVYDGAVVATQAIDLTERLRSARVIDRLQPLHVEAATHPRNGELRGITRRIAAVRAA